MDVEIDGKWWSYEADLTDLGRDGWKAVVLLVPIEGRARPKPIGEVKAPDEREVKRRAQRFARQHKAEQPPAKRVRL